MTADPTTSILYGGADKMWHSAHVDIKIPEMVATISENRNQWAAETSVQADQLNAFSRSSL